MSHPNCSPAHVCQEPSGRSCIEPGCDQEAGTLWGPHWCPEHDKERLERITRQLSAIASQMRQEEKA